MASHRRKIPYQILMDKVVVITTANFAIDMVHVRPWCDIGVGTSLESVSVDYTIVLVHFVGVAVEEPGTIYVRQYRTLYSSAKTLQG